MAVFHMQSLSFTDAAQNGAVYSKDRGVDIISSGAVAQVKCNFRGNPTPRIEVSGLIGDTTPDTPHHGKHLLFYTTKFTEDALAKSNDANIALFSFNEHGVVTAESFMAKHNDSSAGEG
jgi:hypothetical protein